MIIVPSGAGHILCDSPDSSPTALDDVLLRSGYSAYSVLAYGAATALSLPGGTVLTMTGGFLFGLALGPVFSIAAATIGATVKFLIAKTSVGDGLRTRAGPTFQSMASGFTKNTFSHLPPPCLIPLFPFFVVNLMPAFFGGPLRTYVMTTFIGIAPGAFVSATAGASIGGLLGSSETFSPDGDLTPEVLMSLTELGIMSLLPVFYKRYLGNCEITD